MKTQNKGVLTLSALLGITMAGTLCVTAHAQADKTSGKKSKGKKMKDSSSGDKVMSSDKTMSSDPKMSSDRSTAYEGSMSDNQARDETMADPLPMSYPATAPGGLHLFHYATYRGEKMVSGTPMDQKMMNSDKMMSSDRSMAYEGSMSDNQAKGETMADPLPMNYPATAPGGLHLFHFANYRAEKMVSGTPMDQKMMQEDMMKQKMMSDQMQMAEHRAMAGDYTMMTDEFEMGETMADPLPMNYPATAPGAVHLYHFANYRAEKMVSGTPMDQKMDNEMKMNKMKNKKMKKGASMGGSSTSGASDSSK